MTSIEPIGTFHTRAKFPYEARRQATANHSAPVGEIRLLTGLDFEQALEDVEGFERIWILYLFHHNPEWKAKVMPPRGPRQKRGVFATRAPYRPNAIGMSCVRLLAVEGLKVWVEGHDLLDGTPVLDIKPYLPYADAFPKSKIGWLENVEEGAWEISFTTLAEAQLAWLETRGVTELRGFAHGQLEFDPLDHKRKRVVPREGGYSLSYRTWRLDFIAQTLERRIQIESIRSGYSEADLAQNDDRYMDKSVHREFNRYRVTFAKAALLQK